MRSFSQTAQSEATDALRIKGLPSFPGPLYEVTTADSVVLLDAVSDAPLSPLNRGQVAELPQNYYVGSARLVSIELLTGEALLEIQGRVLPLWRAMTCDCSSAGAG